LARRSLLLLDERFRSIIPFGHRYLILLARLAWGIPLFPLTAFGAAKWREGQNAIRSFPFTPVDFICRASPPPPSSGTSTATFSLAWNGFLVSASHARLPPSSACASWSPPLRQVASRRLCCLLISSSSRGYYQARPRFPARSNADPLMANLPLATVSTLLFPRRTMAGGSSSSRTPWTVPYPRAIALVIRIMSLLRSIPCARSSWQPRRHRRRGQIRIHASGDYVVQPNDLPLVAIYQCDNADWTF